MIFIYDDRPLISDEAKALSGVKRYGDLLDQGISLRVQMKNIVNNAGITWNIWMDESDIEEGDFIIWPARLVCLDPDQGVSLIKKLIALDDGDGIELDGVVIYRGKPNNIMKSSHFGMDLSTGANCLQFLSSGLSARAFNSVTEESGILTKRSEKKEKMKAEHDYIKFLPESHRRFFVIPFDYQDEGKTASYKMERLPLPDSAVLWTHQAFSLGEWEKFLDKCFFFLESRPYKKIEKNELIKIRNEILFEKLEKRLTEFYSDERSKIAIQLLNHSNINLLEQAKKISIIFKNFKDPFDQYTVIGHNDLCLSNILYDKRSTLWKLIDPKGAISLDDAYGYAGYDFGKLSHSVLGGYDYIVKNLSHVDFMPDLSINLKKSDDWLKPHKEIFLNKLLTNDISWQLVRCIEATLFLSMLPLHLDHPKRVLGLALQGIRTIESIEKDNPLW